MIFFFKARILIHKDIDPELQAMNFTPFSLKSLFLFMCLSLSRSHSSCLTGMRGHLKFRAINSWSNPFSCERMWAIT